MNEIQQFHGLARLVKKLNKEVTISADALISTDDEILKLEAENAYLRGVLEEMINPPTILEHDHPFDIASWFVVKAQEALRRE